MDYKFCLLFLLFFLPPCQFYAQKKTIWKEFNLQEGNCSTNLKLYEDESYFLETGCEQRSNVNLGQWEADGLLLRLKPEKIKKGIQISERPFTDQDTGKITVLDQSGKPISGFDFIQFDTRIPIDEIIEEAKHKVNSVGELGLSEIYSSIDTYEGSTRVSVHEGQVLFLFDLYQITDEKILFSPKDIQGKHLTLEVNFPSAVFNYPALSWYKLPSEYIRIGDRNFSFVTKN